MIACVNLNGDHLVLFGDFGMLPLLPVEHPPDKLNLLSPEPFTELSSQLPDCLLTLARIKPGHLKPL